MSRTPARAGARAVVVGLACVFLVLHLPFLPRSLEDLDSINFALGLRDFDVANHQPHPPGYPLFIFAAKGLNVILSSEVHALGVLSIVSGALGVMTSWAFFRRLTDAKGGSSLPLLATMLTATAPLYWFTAARPLSDLPGLAASLGVQAMTLAGGQHLPLAGFLAGLASGIRSQVVWLTLPLLAWMVMRVPREQRVAIAGRTLVLLIAGGLIWFVPMVVIEGGPAAYLRALSSQGTEDLTGVQMLWTTRTPRQVLLVLHSTLIAPWADPILAGLVITLATVGCVVLALRARSTVTTLVAAYVPYLAFDVLFQESITTRYALPIVVPASFLAARGALALPGRAAVLVVALVAAVGATLTQADVVRYAGAEAPAFRLLHDMRATAQARGQVPVLAMHRREDISFRRPITWMADDMPPVAARLAAPPKREWLEAVKYWNGGGRAPIWFVADPLRSDLALFDQAKPPQVYRWPLTYPVLVGGARPNEMDWYELDRPGWYLGEGWALTPESAGVALEDKRGPSIEPIKGWIRRRSEATTLLVGGRNLTTSGEPATLRIHLDGRLLQERSVAPGFFVELSTLPTGALDGAGDYALIEITSTGPVAIEQFDLQSPERVVMGFGEGWHEQEYHPVRGQVWRWMSERGVLRVRGNGLPHVLHLEGVTETFSRASRVTVRVGSRVLLEGSADSSFSFRVPVPGNLLPAAESSIFVETDQFYVPAELDSGTQDRRHLGLKVLKAHLEPAPVGSGLPGQAK